MGRRTKEQERARKRDRRSKERSGRRIVNGLPIADENTLRKVFEEEGIHVSLNLVFAIREHLDRLCFKYKREDAEKAFADIAHIPRSRTGILSRIESSDDPLQVPKKPRDHFTEWRRATTQEEYDAWCNEQSEYQPSQGLVADYEMLGERVSELPTQGKSGRVKRAPSLSQIEGGQRPVPPPTGKNQQK
jgi:hypothetical protein